MDLDERLREGLREAAGGTRFDRERWAPSVSHGPGRVRLRQAPGPRSVRRWVAAAVVTVVLVAGIGIPLALLSGLGGGGSRPGAEPDGTVVSGSGLHLRIPEAWDGRAIGPPGTMFGPVLQASNRPLLQPPDDDLATATRRALEPGQVALVLIDYTETRARLGHQAGDDEEFPVEDLPISIRAEDFQPSFEGVDPSHDFARRTFGVNGRSFDLWVEFGEKPAPEALLAEVNEVLATLLVDPLDAPTGLRTLTDADDGLSITIPAAWIFHQDPSGPAEPRTVFGVGTWAFPRGGDCAPTSAQEALPPDGGLLWLIEYRKGSDPAEFPARPEHFDLDRDTLGHYECSLVPSYLIRFQDAGRYFQAHVAFGPEASDSLGPEFMQALESLEVTAPVPDGCPSETGPWADPDCPLSAWTRAVVEEAGYRVTGDTGSALLAEGRGTEFLIWAIREPLPPPTEGYEPIANIYGNPEAGAYATIYSDNTRFVWAMAGLAVYVEFNVRGPGLGHVLSDLFQASEEVDYDAVDTRPPT
jgi:hypothetical protein